MIFTLIFAFCLAVLDYFVYFHPNNFFFEGDTIHWFYLRHRTVQDFLLSFVRLDPAGWYRPLTNRTVQSIFYPFFGLEPAGYRAVHYILFLCAVFATYRLASIVTGRRAAACIATFFFAIHTVNAFTTFDVLFTPEVVYTFLYICAAIAYLRFRQTNRRGFFIASIGCFAASLCAKEAAATLPLMLIALDVILNRRRILAAVAGVRVHLLILAAYLMFVVGFLGVQRSAFQSILSRPGPEVSYRFALDRTVMDNARLGLSWAFNIPRGWQTESRRLHPWMVTFLRSFRALTAVLAVWLLFRPERKFIIAGCAWFLIAIAPALPLFEHFLPYYLFLPLVGLSIAIGTIFQSAYARAAEYSPAGAGIGLAGVFAVLAVVCIFSARNDARDNRVLGWSSRLALNSVNDLKAQHPALQPNTTIYISDAGEPNLAWDTSQGELFKMKYGDDTLHTLYWSWGEVLTQGVMERGPVVVMEYRQFHLVDVTQNFLAASETPVPYHAPREHRLSVNRAVATAGQQYQLSISGLANADVTVHYTRDGSPVHAFDIHLDNDQQISFDVSDRTEKGTYRFVGFRMPGSDEWIQAAASILIN